MENLLWRKTKMAYKIKVGDKVKSRKTGETFMIIRKNKRGYDVTDDYTEFGTFSPKEFKKEFKN